MRHGELGRFDRHGEPELPRRGGRHGPDHRDREPPRARGRAAHELDEAPHGGGRRKRHHIDVACEQFASERVTVPVGPHGAIDGHDIHLRAVGAKALRKRIPGLERPG
jgi:hypothetical protein